MASKFILAAALATAATLCWQSAWAQASAPVTREQRKTETAAANKAGKLAPAGESNAPVTRPVGAGPAKTRAQRKAETLEARKAGTLVPPSVTQKIDRAEAAKPATKTREQRKAETIEAQKKGELLPAGQGTPVPSK